jgi:hypothetical protein
VDGPFIPSRKILPAACLSLLTACASLPPEDAADASAPKGAVQVGCRSAMQERQAACSPDLLRAGPQGSACAGASERIVSRCQEMPTTTSR